MATIGVSFRSGIVPARRHIIVRIRHERGRVVQGAGRQHNRLAAFNDQRFSRGHGRRGINDDRFGDLSGYAEHRLRGFRQDHAANRLARGLARPSRAVAESQ